MERRFGASDTPNPQAAKVDHQLISLINQELERWEHMQIDGLEQSIVKTLGTSAQNAHRLRTLEVRSLEKQRISNPLFVDMLGMKPRPESVTILQSSVMVIGIQWTHVTNVYIKGADILTLLKLAPQLIHCIWEILVTNTILVTEQQISLATNAQNLIHYSLQSFEIRYPTFDTAMVFNKLNFPNLTEYKIVFALIQFPWDSFLAHIRRSSCPLTSLAIFHSGFSYQDLIDVLSETILLRRLHLISNPLGPAYEHEILQLLSNTAVIDSWMDTAGTLHRQFLPKLESFEFEKTPPINHPSNVDDTTFWELIPNIFGRIPQIGHSKTRPLIQLKIIAYLNLLGSNALTGVVPNFTTPNFLTQKEPLMRLLALIEAGVTLDIRDFSLEYDLLELSMKAHGIFSA